MFHSALDVGGWAFGVIRFRILQPRYRHSHRTGIIAGLKAGPPAQNLARAFRFAFNVQPLVPSRLFISNAGGTAGEGQGGGSVLETLLNLILSDKAGINLQESTGSSKPMEDFIRQFTGNSSAGNGDPLKRETRLFRKAVEEVISDK